MGKLKMKNRMKKLQAIEASGKLGMVEGVIVTPEAAHRLLNNVSALMVAIGDLRILSKLVHRY
jgi:hypothetical protein